ncbi:MAG: SGNH/GDSL hydrolase family protein, partial [Planctomycetaceae bacterium]|nr:SGNH/GDSL hydrolase family protein [Planctomycetaceae bacterium]
WARIVLLLLGAGLIAAGILQRRFGRVYVAVSILVANSFVLFLCCELGAMVINRVTSAVAVDTANALLNEVEKTSVSQEMYVGWRGQPFQGDYLTIGADGLRKTPPIAATDRVPLQVFAFGGSTLWGEGATDAETIPAWLQQLLTEQSDYPIQLTNFGQRGWVSTQGLVQLILEIRAGHIPDLVVFYDGYNEITAAHSTQQIGVPENFWDLRNIDVMQRAAGKVAKGTELGRLLLKRPPRPVFQIDVISTSQKIVNNYLAVLDLTKSLGRQYGFDVLFYWQPQLLTEAKELTPAEAELMNHPWLPEPVKKLVPLVYSAISKAAATQTGLYDIHDCFAGQTEQLYFDPCHITGTGNQMVAESMLTHGMLNAVRLKLQQRKKDD